MLWQTRWLHRQVAIVVLKRKIERLPHRLRIAIFTVLSAFHSVDLSGEHHKSSPSAHGLRCPYYITGNESLRASSSRIANASDNASSTLSPRTV